VAGPKGAADAFAEDLEIEMDRKLAAEPARRAVGWARRSIARGLAALLPVLLLAGTGFEAAARPPAGRSADAQSVAGGAMLSVEETEALVRAHYYEGMPREQAARIGTEGCARLLEMLDDPSESRSHHQVLVALGICAPDGALEAIDAWLAALPTGEIDRPRFRAWLAVSHALASLADRDPRALARLEARMTASEAPRFRHGRHRGTGLVRLRRDGAATGLAETGLPQARAALDRASLRASDAAFRAHLDAVRSLHRERAEQRRSRGDGR
jgi:hypothetical protein